MQADSNTLSRLAENERHFHTIQAGVRGLASTWTLAAFAGIALLLKQEKEVIWLFPPFASVIVVCVMANTGLSLLWIIDQLVYQRLFNTNYIAGLRLEQQFPSIPPVRAIQALTSRGKSIASWVKFFYAWPSLACTIIAIVAASISIFSAKTATLAVTLPGYAMVALASLSVVPIAWIVYRARGVSFFRFAESLPADYSSILKEENCLAIIDRHIQTLNAAGEHAAQTDDKRHGEGHSAA